jgi:hypothetical protein
VSDDDLPNPPNTVTTTWSKVSGPGTVIFDDVNAVDTTAIFTETGVYQLQLTASDGQLSASAEVQITIDSGIRYFNGQVGASSDDAEEKDSGGLSLTSTDLDILLDVSGETEREQVAVGLRFTGVDIPGGVQITNAYVQFQADEKDFTGTELTIFGEAADNAETFVEERENITSRNRTAESVLWEPEPWTKAGEAGPNQRTANIAPVIREIVNRPGWSANNSLVIIITGEGKRTAEAYDGSESGAPRLFVEYSIDRMSYLPTIAAR